MSPGVNPRVQAGGVHQANLTCRSLAEGRIAEVAAQNVAAAAEGGRATEALREEAASDLAVHRRACGMVVRYNKYLVNDYATEFEANIRQWADTL